MKYNSEIHHRLSIRLKGYDYSQKGAYFVTICAQNRVCRFGDVLDGEMGLKDAGRMVQEVWNQISENYSGITTDAFVVMPNHIHGIIIVGAIPRDCPGANGRTEGQPQGVAPTGVLSLPDVVQSFKSLTTKYYIDGVKQRGWRPFHGKLWQRNYYEHIIRNMNNLYETREYIANNPLQWQWDRENPRIFEANNEREHSR